MRARTAWGPAPGGGGGLRPGPPAKCPRPQGPRWLCVDAPAERLSGSRAPGVLTPGACRGVQGSRSESSVTCRGLGMSPVETLPTAVREGLSRSDRLREGWAPAKIRL